MNQTITGPFPKIRKLMKEYPIPTLVIIFIFLFGIISLSFVVAGSFSKSVPTPKTSMSQEEIDKNARSFIDIEQKQEDQDLENQDTYLNSTLNSIPQEDIEALTN